MTYYKVIYDVTCSPAFIKADYFEVCGDDIDFFNLKDETEDEHVAGFNKFVWFCKMEGLEDEDQAEEESPQQECRLCEELNKFIGGFGYKEKDKK